MLQTPARRSFLWYWRFLGDCRRRSRRGFWLCLFVSLSLKNAFNFSLAVCATPRGGAAGSETGTESTTTPRAAARARHPASLLHYCCCRKPGRVLVTPPSCTTSSHVVFSLCSQRLWDGAIGCVVRSLRLISHALPPEHRPAQTKAHCLPSN